MYTKARIFYVFIPSYSSKGREGSGKGVQDMRRKGVYILAEKTINKQTRITRSWTREMKKTGVILRNLLECLKYSIILLWVVVP